MATSRVHVSCFPGLHCYEIALGRQYGRPWARFRSPEAACAVLRGLRFMDRKRRSITEMAAYLKAGERWAAPTSEGT